MGLHYAGVRVHLREVKLADKPDEMIALSPKATVPVLVLEDGSVIDESLDILRWALNRNDPDGWSLNVDPTQQKQALALIAENDGRFKYNLDRYKYAERYPEHSQTCYRSEGEQFLAQLDQHLADGYLLGKRCSIADVAIFPFVRQFAHCDRDWFYQTPYPALHTWLDGFLQSDRFKSVMQKFPRWEAGAQDIVFPN